LVACLLFLSKQPILHNFGALTQVFTSQQPILQNLVVVAPKIANSKREKRLPNDTKILKKDLGVVYIILTT